MRAGLGSDEILDRLSLIGQDITASLDFEDIFAAVERHVGALLDAATFYIGILDEGREWIDVPIFIDGGRRSQSRRLRVDDAERPASRAVRENREILREKSLDDALRADIPGTAPTLSALFRPLSVRDRMIGVMSVQSARAGAYGQRERLIFRALCSYVAVALANGASFRRLAAAEAERMTSLTRLVAGIAHEVNTPVGMALTVATTFDRAAREFQEKLETGALRRSDLEAFAGVSVEAARQVSANLVRTTDLMDEFRQVGLDQRSARARTFGIADLVRSVLTSLGLELQGQPCTIEIAVPSDLEVTSDPEALGRVLGHLIANVLAFAFPKGERGTLRIEAEMSARNELRVAIIDNGVGIPDPELAVIFEPFSPTSRGSRGLGLHIAYSLAISVLRGALTCQTVVGHGTTFCLTIPTRLPTV
ncbi:sensor histidine kinase [Enterovirga sp. CN4-39]|uniref:sensor histidine kinase n=1 Tax=Enterovirga sp. CN4-39 TaxID=3400910 RepID=UPI003C109ED0